MWTFAGYQRQSGEQEHRALAQALLQSIARCLLPKRPGRIEPRAKKRRPKPLALLRRNSTLLNKSYRHRYHWLCCINRPDAAGRLLG